ncbi:chromate efflux transporter, partial [Polymorphobacter multimanifer]|uniref:chromate efflux transporter n=1 Tax=Polymorphobacter multimanifer TaxID=1070431 RepID=UPI001FB0C5FF
MRSSAAPSAGEVFRAFLKLGLTSFGGPVAHIGYFRTELVLRRGWVDEAEFADLLALCQFLPGPASSQLGFALGLRRAGGLGALAAWGAFTLPAALFMLLVALGAGVLGGPLGLAVVHGLKLVAVAIVAQAVWGMAQTLTPDGRRRAIALVAGALVVLVGGALAQTAAIVAGALLGWVLCKGAAVSGAGGRWPQRLAPAYLIGFFTLLLGLPVLVEVTGWQGLALFDAFYRAGALVFGGGHVVQPLLEAEIVGAGWMSADA